MASAQDLVPLVMPGEHEYEGIRFPALTSSATLDALKTWEVRSDDIFCITYPKSGTHWIFEITSLIVNGGDPSKIERSHMVTGPEMSIVSLGSLKDPEVVKAAPPGYKVIESWESPRVIPTHLLEQFFPPNGWEKKVKMIYLARNPKDVFCSAASFMLPLFPQELQDFDNYVKYALLGDKVTMGTWFQHVLGYAKHHNDDNFLFVKYEDLQKDLLGQVKRIAKFLDRPLTNDLAEKIATLCTMKEMKKTYDKHEEEDPQGKMHTRAFGQLKFLNKGKVGTWREKITGDLNELFDKVYNEKMADSGLEFDFEI